MAKFISKNIPVKWSYKVFDNNLNLIEEGTTKDREAIENKYDKKHTCLFVVAETKKFKMTEADFIKNAIKEEKEK